MGVLYTFAAMFAMATAGQSSGRVPSPDRSSLLLVGYEGTRAAVRDHLGTGKRYCGAGSVSGSEPAERWFQERYDAPYLRDSLVDHRIMVDTVETAAVWSNLERLYDGARQALLNGIWGTRVQGLVGCHVSHVYPEGASLYFTFLARQKRGEELAQYDAALGFYENSVRPALVGSKLAPLLLAGGEGLPVIGQHVDFPTK